MESGLLHDYFGNFSMQDERYYFHVEGSRRGEDEPTLGEIEMNIRQLRNWMEGILDLHKSGNDSV